MRCSCVQQSKRLLGHSRPFDVSSRVLQCARDVATSVYGDGPCTNSGYKGCSRHDRDENNVSPRQNRTRLCRIPRRRRNTCRAATEELLASMIDQLLFKDLLCDVAVVLPGALLVGPIVKIIMTRQGCALMGLQVSEGCSNGRSSLIKLQHISHQP